LGLDNFFTKPADPADDRRIAQTIGQLISKFPKTQNSTVNF
jgi:hypothetical protein